MESFEHLVKVFLESQYYVVTTNIKLPVRKRTKKVQREEYQTHGHEVDIVAAKSDSLLLGSVKSFFGSKGVSRKAFRVTTDEPDGSYLAAASYGDMKVYGSYDDRVYFFSREGSLLWSYKTRSPVGQALVSSDGSYIAAKDQSGYLYFFDREGRLLWKGGAVVSISISSDASHIAAGGSDGKVYLYNREGKLPFDYEIIDPREGGPHGTMIDNVSISSDGSYIAVGSPYGRVYFFGRKTQ